MRAQSVRRLADAQRYQLGSGHVCLRVVVQGDEGVELSAQRGARRPDGGQPGAVEMGRRPHVVLLPAAGLPHCEGAAEATQPGDQHRVLRRLGGRRLGAAVRRRVGRARLPLSLDAAAARRELRLEVGRLRRRAQRRCRQADSVRGTAGMQRLHQRAGERRGRHRGGVLQLHPLASLHCARRGATVARATPRGAGGGRCTVLSSVVNASLVEPHELGCPDTTKPGVHDHGGNRCRPWGEG
mmetsp:Transcript_16916/g.53938  ORF Transcript_16916/g.53938 Transcript_16916/m.53938 type:complete len:240 (-) Transcript_16916:29-748(-)